MIGKAAEKRRERSRAVGELLVLELRPSLTIQRVRRELRIGKILRDDFVLGLRGSEIFSRIVQLGQAIMRLIEQRALRILGQQVFQTGGGFRRLASSVLRSGEEEQRFIGPLAASAYLP
jgi:hypothetical protein